MKKQQDIGLNPENKQSLFLPWLYWGIAAFFFFVEYFVRVSPSVMADDLMRDLNATALALGSLSAFFHYAYLGMQIPVGMLVDRFGPRILLTFATALGALASYWFANAESVAAASAARFALGFGSSFAFVSALKLATTWLPARFWGMVVGITQGLGMLGACVGAAPMAFAVNVWGWRHTLELIAILLVVMAILIAIIVRDQQFSSKKSISFEKNSISHSLKIVLSSRQTWFNAAFAGLLFAPTALFGELWGVSFLTSTSPLSVNDAAYAIGLIFIGWAIGGPTVGWISDKIQQRKIIMKISALSGLLLLPPIIFFSEMPYFLLMACMFTYGFFNSGLVASYALCTEINPKSVSGVALGFTNMASVIIGALLQPVVGGLLDLQWDGTMQNGIPIYAKESFQGVMLLMPITSLLALWCVSKVEETYCKPLEIRGANGAHA